MMRLQPVRPDLAEMLKDEDGSKPVALASMHGVFIVIYDGPVSRVMFEHKGKPLALVEFTDETFSVRLPEKSDAEAGTDG